MTYAVGIIGAGPGVSALHLPTIERLAEIFRVVHISDGGSGRAAALAERIGARSSSGTADLLADERIDVVAICSRPEQHAEQIIAAVDAGVRAVMCEKPLATTREDAERVIDVCRRSGTVLLIGTNHLYDDAWARTKHHLLAAGSPVRTVAVTASLPPNGRYHAAVTDDLPTLPFRGGPPDLTDPHRAAAVARQLILGLAVHDLPLLRDLAPGSLEGLRGGGATELVYARAVEPIGVVVGYRLGTVLVHVTAVMHAGGAEALWRVGVFTADDRIDIEFPPPFVHAGSAAVRVRSAGGRVTQYPRVADDGYLHEWRALAALLDSGEPVEYEEILDDARYALALADATADVIREGGRS